MPCGQKDAMDRHRVRLSIATSSQDVPVRAHASGRLNTIAWAHTGGPLLEGPGAPDGSCERPDTQPLNQHGAERRSG